MLIHSEKSHSRLCGQIDTLTGTFFEENKAVLMKVGLPSTFVLVAHHSTTTPPLTLPLRDEATKYMHHVAPFCVHTPHPVVVRVGLVGSEHLAVSFVPLELIAPPAFVPVVVAAARTSPKHPST